MTLVTLITKVNTFINDTYYRDLRISFMEELFCPSQCEDTYEIVAVFNRCCSTYDRDILDVVISQLPSSLTREELFTVLHPVTNNKKHAKRQRSTFDRAVTGLCRRRILVQEEDLRLALNSKLTLIALCDDIRC